MDLGRVIKMCEATGKIYYGLDETKKQLEKKNVKLLIVSKNCPSKNFSGKKYNEIPIYHFEGTNMELGTLCGKPYSISIISVVDPGTSSILSLEN